MNNAADFLPKDPVTLMSMFATIVCVAAGFLLWLDNRGQQ